MLGDFVISCREENKRFYLANVRGQSCEKAFVRRYPEDESVHFRFWLLPDRKLNSVDTCDSREVRRGRARKSYVREQSIAPHPLTHLRRRRAIKSGSKGVNLRRTHSVFQRFTFVDSRGISERERERGKKRRRRKRRRTVKSSGGLFVNELEELI